jgi:hypothetical protein
VVTRPRLAARGLFRQQGDDESGGLTLARQNAWGEPRNVFENTNVTFAEVDHAMLRWPELAVRGAPRRRALRPPLPA